MSTTTKNRQKSQETLSHGCHKINSNITSVKSEKEDVPKGGSEIKATRGRGMLILGFCTLQKSNREVEMKHGNFFQIHRKRMKVVRTIREMTSDMDDG